MEVGNTLRLGATLIAWFLTAAVTYGQIPVTPNSGNTNESPSISIDAKPPVISYHDHPATWSIGYDVVCRTAKACSRKAKRFLKRGHYIDGLGYAAETFTYDPKRRVRQKALKLITEHHYHSAIKEYEVDLQQYPMTDYENYRSTKNVYYRWWHKNRFNMVLASLQEYNDLFRLNLQPIDTHSMETLVARLSEYRTFTAADYYEVGMYWKKHATGKQHYKKAHMAFRIADYYVSGYQDAKSQAAALKPLAISTVYLSTHYDGYTKYGQLLDEQVQSAMMQFAGWRDMQFVRFTKDRERADYRITLSIDPMNVEEIPQSTERKDFSKDVTDAHGNITTKNAVIKTYSKGRVAYAKVTVEVVEQKSQEIVYATTAQNSHHFVSVWQLSSGDTSIVPQKEKQHLGQSPQALPKYTVLFEQAISHTARPVAVKLFEKVIYHLGSIPNDEK